MLSACLPLLALCFHTSLASMRARCGRHAGGKRRAGAGQRKRQGQKHGRKAARARKAARLPSPFHPQGLFILLLWIGGFFLRLPNFHNARRFPSLIRSRRAGAARSRRARSYQRGRAFTFFGGGVSFFFTAFLPRLACLSAC